MQDTLTKQDVIDLTIKHGAGWCQCVQGAMDILTPEALEAYCLSKGLEHFGKVSTDITGKRYCFFLRSRNVVDEAGQTRKQNICVSFGEFFHYAKSTMDSCLHAVWQLAEHFQMAPLAVLEEIKELGVQSDSCGATKPDTSEEDDDD